MPALTTTQRPVQEVRKGDHISGRRVETVEAKVKWVSARDAEGRLIFRQERDSLITVQRMEKTEDEKAAELLEYKNESLTRVHEKMLNGVELAKNDLRAKLDADGYVNPELMGSIVEAQELRHQAMVISRILEHNPDMDMFTAFSHQVEDVKDALVQGQDSPTWSGGFTFKNAELQSKNEARRKFVKSIVWMSI